MHTSTMRDTTIPNRATKLSLICVSLYLILLLLFYVTGGKANLRILLAPETGNLSEWLLPMLLPLIGLFAGIVAKGQEARRTLTLRNGKLLTASLGITIAVIQLVYQLIAFSVIGSYKPRLTPLELCTYQQRELATNILIYASDHNLILPDIEELRKGAERKQFHCTVRKALTPGSIGYNHFMIHRNLEEKNLSYPHRLIVTADCLSADGYLRKREDMDDRRHFLDPPRGELFWEWPPYLQKRGFVVGYLDGHVEVKQAGEKVRLKP